MSSFIGGHLPMEFFYWSKSSYSPTTSIEFLKVCYFLLSCATVVIAALGLLFVWFLNIPDTLRTLFSNNLKDMNYYFFKSHFISRHFNRYQLNLQSKRKINYLFKFLEKVKIIFKNGSNKTTLSQ